VTSEHGLREWRNGNLRACVEPADGAFRLRMGTVKSGASETNVIAAIIGVLGIAGFTSFGLWGGSDAVFLPWIMGASSASVLLANAFRLRNWARRREDQMRHIGEVAARLIT
ncbi:MAG: hypothetical protein ABIV28_08685, partial [Longimicrobiales bacterium]